MYEHACSVYTYLYFYECENRIPMQERNRIDSYVLILFRNRVKVHGLRDSSIHNLFIIVHDSRVCKLRMRLMIENEIVLIVEHTFQFWLLQHRYGRVCREVVVPDVDALGPLSSSTEDPVRLAATDI